MENEKKWPQALQRKAWLEAPLEGYLLEREFFSLPELDQYRQPFEDGFRTVILSLSAYPDQTLCEVHVGIRLDRIENIVFPFTQGRPSYRPNSMTLVTPLARLAGVDQHRYELTGPRSARKALAGIVDQLEKTGFPFLDAFSDLESMDALYNDDPERADYLMHNRLHRCLRAITLARLLDREDFLDIVEDCRHELKTMHTLPQWIQRFEDLARILPNYSEN